MPETAAPMRAPARAARSAYQFVEAVIAAPLWSVPPLGTAAFAFGGVRALWIRTEPLLAVTLAEEATRFLDTPVAVRRVTLKPGAIELHGVRVAEPSIGRQAKQSRELLGVDRITIPLPGDLVSRLSDGQHPLVDSVLVEGARGHLRRDARGRWNFEYL
ncbi:MAG: hypothetical protein FJX72_00800, partial [Armatimonadetes bacterium]|nr:hypothetical protein [Armatimonadota bacterium]